MPEDQGEAHRPGPIGPNQTSREKQVQRLQKQAERLGKWLKENKGKYGATGKEINSNGTDNDSPK